MLPYMYIWYNREFYVNWVIIKVFSPIIPIYTEILSVYTNEQNWNWRGSYPLIRRRLYLFDHSTIIIMIRCIMLCTHLQNKQRIKSLLLSPWGIPPFTSTVDRKTQKKIKLALKAWFSTFQSFPIGEKPTLTYARKAYRLWQ